MQTVSMSGRNLIDDFAQPQILSTKEIKRREQLRAWKAKQGK